jgi:glycerol-3-phosphate dehydrogenase (NAD(P)+)
MALELERPRVGVAGAGAWGSALALSAARGGCAVLLYGRDALAIDEMRLSRVPPSLPEARLPESVELTHRPGDLAAADVLLLAVPAQASRAAMADIAPSLRDGTVVVSCAKGIERTTGKLLTDVIAEVYDRGPLAVLSGPGFAVDLAHGLPTAVTIAADDPDLAEALARLLAGPSFRPYAAGDIIGVELGGALKNVLAIAAGMVIGRGLGLSAQAAVITRGFVEMRRLAVALGARAETLMGLSGFGDLQLTCSSPQSRNYSLGLAIGGGASPASFSRLAEGAATAAVAVARADAAGIEVPIMAAVADILDGRASIEDVVDRLMARPLKRED